MRTLYRFIAFSLPVLIMPLYASAACGSGGGLMNPLGSTCDISTFIRMLLDLVAYIAMPIIVLFLVYIGFLFVTSQGNPEKIKEAREYFFWALVGALLVLGAKALSLAIEATVRQL